MTALISSGAGRPSAAVSEPDAEASCSAASQPCFARWSDAKILEQKCNFTSVCWQRRRVTRTAQWRCEHYRRFARHRLSAMLLCRTPSAHDVLLGGEADLAARRCASGQRRHWVALTHTMGHAALQPLHPQHRAMLGPFVQ